MQPKIIEKRKEVTGKRLTNMNKGKQVDYIIEAKCSRRQVQEGAPTHPEFCFSNFLLTFYSSVEFLHHSSHACRESVTVSFLQSEIQQQVLVFHK